MCANLTSRMWNSEVVVTSEQLTREFHNKRLRIEFVDGEVAEVTVLMVSECDEHEDCRGITYDLISTNRKSLIKARSTYWAELKCIKNFELSGASTE